MNKNNKFTITEYIEKIKFIYPNWSFDVIEFNGYKNPSIIKCNNCGELLKINKAEYILRKINPCLCSKFFKNGDEKITYLSKLFNFSIISYNKEENKFIIKCGICGKINHRSKATLLATPNHCDNCRNYAKGKLVYSKEDVQNILDEKLLNEYILIEYSGMQKKGILIHKNCGEELIVCSIADLFNGRNRGCWHCYKNKSIGEQRIYNFLRSKKLDFIQQKTFDPLDNKNFYRFDFYLPEFNLAIEYQGEQHYRNNGFFKDSLSKIQERDNIKRNYCYKNNIELLEIKYNDLDKINLILNSKFNDYRKSNGEVE